MSMVQMRVAAATMDIISQVEVIRAYLLVACFEWDTRSIMIHSLIELMKIEL